MPLVFVHGVNTRYDPAHPPADMRMRDHLFSTLLLADGPASPDPPADIAAPYWGDLGVRLPDPLKSLPLDRPVALGSASEPLSAEATDLLAAAIAASGSRDGLLPKIAETSVLEALDLALLGARRDPGTDPAVLSRVEAEWTDWLIDAVGERGTITAAQLGLKAKTNDDFVLELGQLVEADRASHAASLGPSEWFETVRQGAASLVGSARNATGDAVLSLARRPLNGLLAQFVGDVLVYIEGRGTSERPGDIPERIIAALQDAVSRRRDGAPLIVIGHSLGGIILYDALTRFRDRLGDGFRIDAFVTVGSQVGVFQEMGLFRPFDGAAPLPVGCWINVVDPVDVLSFSAKAVFPAAEDVGYSSATGILSAHSAYFDRASFHRRLRKRLQGLGVLG